MMDVKRVREVINEYVEIMVGEIEEEKARITFVARGKGPLGRQVWRVNVRYTPKTGKETTALFKIDAETGEVLEFREGFFGVVDLFGNFLLDTVTEMGRRAKGVAMRLGFFPLRRGGVKVRDCKSSLPSLSG